MFKGLMLIGILATSFVNGDDTTAYQTANLALVDENQQAEIGQLLQFPNSIIFNVAPIDRHISRNWGNQEEVIVADFPHRFNINANPSSSFRFTFTNLETNQTVRCDLAFEGMHTTDFLSGLHPCNTALFLNNRNTLYYIMPGCDFSNWKGGDPVFIGALYPRKSSSGYQIEYDRLLINLRNFEYAIIFEEPYWNQH